MATRRKSLEGLFSRRVVGPPRDATTTIDSRWLEVELPKARTEPAIVLGKCRVLVSSLWPGEVLQPLLSMDVPAGTEIGSIGS